MWHMENVKMDKAFIYRWLIQYQENHFVVYGVQVSETVESIASGLLSLGTFNQQHY